MLNGTKYTLDRQEYIVGQVKKNAHEENCKHRKIKGFLYNKQ